MAKVNVRDRNRNNPDKKPNWEYYFETARVNGIRNKVSKSGFETKKAALEAGVKALAEYNNTGKYFEPKNISVSDYFDYWLHNYAEKNLAFATIQAYSNIVRNHIKPEIGYYRLKDVDTLTLQELINKIYTQKSFSKSFMKNILKVIKGAFHYARAVAKFVQIDYSLDVMLPKRFPQKELVNEVKKEDVEKILTRFKNSPHHYYALLIGYYTGLRVSEVYGLTWDCIDFENKTLTVNKAEKEIDIDCSGMRHGGIKRRAAQKQYLGECKNTSSQRTIIISDTLLNALREYKNLQEQNKELFQELYIENYLRQVKTSSGRIVYQIVPVSKALAEELAVNLPKCDLVVVKDNGTFQGTYGMKYVSKVINFELGIPFRFHAFRHNHASVLYENGAPIKDIQARLGHSSITTTMNTYVSNTQKNQEKTIQIFDDNVGLNINLSPRNQRLYEQWKSLVNRCKTSKAYVRNGIKLCDEWQTFGSFEKWALENGYNDVLYLKRIDTNKNYYPENCRWVTQHEVKATNKKAP